MTITSLEQERDNLLAVVDHLRLLTRQNGLTLRQFRVKVGDYVERAFADSPTIERMDDEIRALKERLRAAEKVKEAGEAVYIVSLTLDGGQTWHVQKVFRDEAVAKSYVRKLSKTWGDSYSISAERVI